MMVSFIKMQKGINGGYLVLELHLPPRIVSTDRAKTWEEEINEPLVTAYPPSA